MGDYAKLVKEILKSRNIKFTDDQLNGFLTKANYAGFLVSPDNHDEILLEPSSLGIAVSDLLNYDQSPLTKAFQNFLQAKENKPVIDIDVEKIFRKNGQFFFDSNTMDVLRSCLNDNVVEYRDIKLSLTGELSKEDFQVLLKLYNSIFTDLSKTNNVNENTGTGTENTELVTYTRENKNKKLETNTDKTGLETNTPGNNNNSASLKVFDNWDDCYKYVQDIFKQFLVPCFLWVYRMLIEGLSYLKQACLYFYKLMLDLYDTLSASEFIRNLDPDYLKICIVAIIVIFVGVAIKKQMNSVPIDAN